MSTIKKLEQWIQDHPDKADTPFMNVTTQEQFTLTQILETMKKEKESGVAITEEGFLHVKAQVVDWIKEV